MSKPALGLGVACIALVVTVIAQWIELHRAAPAISRPAAEHASTSETIRAGNLACQSGKPPAPVSSPELVASEVPLPPEVDDESVTDPEFVTAMIDYQKIAMRQQYAAFIASLHLPADKADRFSQLLAEQWTRKVINRVPMDYESREWAGGNDDELRTVLSQPQIDTFHHYQETAATRGQVEMLRNELMSTPDPLRDEQIAPLVDALHAEEMRLMTETRDYDVAVNKSDGAAAESMRLAESYFLERETAANERELSAASALLSREQLKALERHLDARRSLGIAGAKLRRLDRERADAESAGP
ncbi:MAG TPA: hypothetical protein VM146_08270 [Steroidobacteraceae bacterium]|nr:hypothetical protein [Steroidobacteraceae bacterium]